MTIMKQSTGARIVQSLWAYTKALLVNAVALTLFFMAGFAIAGMPWWPITGFLCGVLNVIPYAGPLLSLGLALLIAFFASADWTKLAIIGGIWLAGQIVDGFILSPRAAGEAGVNPLLSIVLVLVAGLVFGPAGMVLAVPVCAVVFIIARAARSR